ncbi:hypothetical protein ACWGDE_01520 [Streptomyces sp. NPDC054956]
MSPGEAAAVTVAVICAAVYVAYRILCWLLDRSIRARREENLELDRWQQTAYDAARRNEDDVRRDLAKAKAALDLTTCLAIWNITPHDIPHQTRKTRRTEEDQ